MATQNLALKPAESEPFIPDEDIERLIAEMFGRARKPASRLMTPPTPTEAPPPVAPPQHVPALAPEPVAVPASTFAPEIDGEVEPLQIRSETRRSRGRGWTTPFALSVLAIGGGWWLAASGAPAWRTTLIPGLLAWNSKMEVMQLGHDGLLAARWTVPVAFGGNPRWISSRILISASNARDPACPWPGLGTSCPPSMAPTRWVVNVRVPSGGTGEWPGVARPPLSARGVGLPV